MNKKFYIFILFCLIVINSNAEMRIIRSNNIVVSVNIDMIIAIEQFDLPDGSNRFYSRAQGKIITLDPRGYASAISAGLSNGNLKVVGRPATRILLKSEANTQVAVAGSAMLGGGDAKNINKPNELIVDMNISDVLSQLYPERKNP